MLCEHKTFLNENKTDAYSLVVQMGSYVNHRYALPTMPMSFLSRLWNNRLFFTDTSNILDCASSMVTSYSNLMCKEVSQKQKTKTEITSTSENSECLVLFQSGKSSKNESDKSSSSYLSLKTGLTVFFLTCVLLRCIQDWLGSKYMRT